MTLGYSNKVITNVQGLFYRPTIVLETKPYSFSSSGCLSLFRLVFLMVISHQWDCFYFVYCKFKRFGLQFLRLEIFKVFVRACNCEIIYWNAFKLHNNILLHICYIIPIIFEFTIYSLFRGFFTYNNFTYPNFVLQIVTSLWITVTVRITVGQPGSSFIKECLEKFSSERTLKSLKVWNVHCLYA